MNPFETQERSTRSRSELIFAISQIIFAVSSLAALILSLTDRIVINTATEIVLSVIVFASLYIGGTYLFVQRLRRVKLYKFRLAVTGLPGAGKTVFTILLFDALMNERLPRVGFSAESRSVISVYQAIRDLPAGKWPAATSKGDVSLYEGTIETDRSKVDLEVGDSAGEYWLDFGNERERDPGYLQYVLSSHGIAHVIPLDELLSDPSGSLSREIEDLRLVARLKQNIRGAKSVVPLLVVLSKVDLVFPARNLRMSSGLLRVVDAEGLPGLDLLGEGSTELRDDIIATLRTLWAQLQPNFASVDFVFSSAPVIAEGRLRIREHGGDLVRWILYQARQPKSSARRSGAGFVELS